MWRVENYDEEFFRSLFDVINKIEIGKICIQLDELLRSNKKVKNICTKIQNHIKNDLQTQNMISNYVSCFIYFI